MTEHKFGTWYPIEYLKEFDKDVLLCRSNKILVGHKAMDEEGDFDGWYTDDDDEILRNPTHFMPLPPRPESVE